jgi:hypothetical protein
MVDLSSGGPLHPPWWRSPLRRLEAARYVKFAPSRGNELGTLRADGVTADPEAGAFTV